MAKITHVQARQILNAKGLPTVEVSLMLDSGALITSSAPSGTSVSSHEAKELKDQDPAAFGGNGVLKAVNNVNSLIAPAIVGKDATAQAEIDKTLLQLDGTPDKSKLGVNAILPVSMAVAKAGAKSMNIELFTYIGGFLGIQDHAKIPTTCYNIINGGKHAGDNLDFQEFMIIPATSIPYPTGLNMAVSIYHSLKINLKDKGLNNLLGDEGGFGPTFATNRDALVMLTEAIGSSNLRMNYDMFLGIDAASNNFFKDGKYHIKDKAGPLSSKELLTVYENLNDEYNLLYLEDPFAEDDWEGWTSLNNITAKNTMVVGDDLIATNIVRLQTAIEKKAVGALIVKPNQIGTIIETLAVVGVARNAGLKIVVSHRSGDTNDDFIADFAVGVGADYTKFGAPARGERVAKYNRLLAIDALIRNR
jgi:enolase